MAGASGESPDKLWSWHDNDWHSWNDNGQSWRDNEWSLEESAPTERAQRNGGRQREARRWDVATTTDTVALAHMLEEMREELRRFGQVVAQLEQRIAFLEQSHQNRGDEQARGSGDGREIYRVCRNVATCGLEFRVSRHHLNDEYCCSRCRKPEEQDERGAVRTAGCSRRSRRAQ